MIPVHNHSEYSALDGFSHVSEIAERIAELGLKGAFLTDHGTVAGLWHFAKAMRDAGLYCGFGMEAYQASNSRLDTTKEDGDYFKKGEDAFHLILLAKNEEGYRNLLRISDDAHRNGFYYDPRVDWDSLKKYKEGIICTTACMGSLPNQRLINHDDESMFNKMHRLFEDDFYVELHTYDHPDQVELNKRLTSIAKDRGIPVVYANDAHYSWPEEYEIHEALLAAQYHEYINGPKKYANYVEEGIDRHHPPCLYIMSEADVREALSYLPESVVNEAIANSDLLSEQCQVELEKPRTYLPVYKVEESFKDSADMLKELAIEGFERKYEEDDEVAMDRLIMEYNAICDAGLADYFLIQWDIIQFALRQGIMPGPGRGSAGGSLLAYVLDITSIDPIKYDLQFERFWNPGRSDGLPDIDIDYEKSRVQEVRQYALNKYGENRVLRIGNHARLQPKSAIDKAGALCYQNAPYSDMKRIKGFINETVDAGQQPPWDEMWAQLGTWAEVEDEPHPLEEYCEKYPAMFEVASELSGRISTYGVHASAVVISDVDLNDRLPARMATDKSTGEKVLVTQAEMRQVEKEGFPKFDFLALRNLDTIMMAALLSGEFGEDTRETRQKVVQHFREEVNYDHLADSYYEQIDNKQTLGLFQIEDGRSARGIGKDIKPRSVEDLALIVALNRPGPLRSKDADGRNMVSRFVARRNDEEETVYPHDILDEILAPTYGDFLYQEQVIAYFRALGYSLSDADHIRKILGKKLVSDMQAELPRYLELAEQFMPRAVAESIWALIEDFSKYSFNKAHAVGYGLILAWTMYAKKRWPLEFVLASIITNPKRVPDYIREARRIEVEVLPPDVQTSDILIARKENAIMYGLRDIKGVGEAAAKWVVENRPFESPEDFYRRAAEIKNTPVNAGTRKTLMAAGAFDSFGYRLSECTKCEGKGRVPEMVPKKNNPNEMKRVLVGCPKCVGLGAEKVEVPSGDEILKAEVEYLGIMLTDPNEGLIQEHFEYLETLDAYHLADTDEKGLVHVPGVVSNVSKGKIKSGRNAGEEYGRVNIEWRGEELMFTAWPETWERFKGFCIETRLCEFTLETGPKGLILKKAERFT